MSATGRKMQTVQRRSRKDDDSNVAALLLTCRAIHQEAAVPFYRHNAFVIKCQTSPPSSTATAAAHGLATSLSFFFFFFFFLSEKSHQSHHLVASGLPHAFDNRLFRANAQHVTFLLRQRGIQSVSATTSALPGRPAAAIVSARSRTLVPRSRLLAVREPDVEGHAVGGAGTTVAGYSGWADSGLLCWRLWVGLRHWWGWFWSSASGLSSCSHRLRTRERRRERFCGGGSSWFIMVLGLSSAAG